MSDHRVDESVFFRTYHDDEMRIKLVDGSMMYGRVHSYNDLSLFLLVERDASYLRLVPRTAILYVEPNFYESVIVELEPPAP